MSSRSGRKKRDDEIEEEKEREREKKKNNFQELWAVFLGELG
jgi:hypothetical protein